MVEDVHFEAAPVAGQALGLSQELLVAEVAERAHIHGCKYNTGCEIAALAEVLDQAPTTPGRRAMAPARAHGRGVRGAQAITASRAHQGPPAAAQSASTPSRTFWHFLGYFMLAGGSPRRARRALSACGADCSRKGALVTALDEQPRPATPQAPSTRLCRTPSVVSPVDRDNLFRMQETDRQRSLAHPARATKWGRTRCTRCPARAPTPRRDIRSLPAARSSGSGGG